MIGSDLPHYIRYNPRIFAQANSTSSTGLILESYDNKVSLALGNNSSNSFTSNIIFLTSEDNSFKIQYETSNTVKDIVSYSFNNNINSILNGNQTADKYYVRDFIDTSIILNDDPYKIAGIGYNKTSNSVNYNTTIDGKHTFKANAGSLDIDIVSLYYSNSTQQLVIHGDGLNPQSHNIPSLDVNGSANINGNLNVNGAILGTFPSGVVQLNSNNKIEPSLLPQLAPDFRVLKSGRNIGIGTKNPISKLHIYNGDLLVQNGWIGINTNSNISIAYPPKYPLHINYEINTLPALVLTSNNIVNFIAYADHPAIGIGTNKIDSPNIAIYANGDLQCSNIIATGLNIFKNNEYVLYYENYNSINALVSKYPLVLNDKLFVSTILSSDTSKNINFSNCDLIVDGDVVVNNNSIKKLLDQHYNYEYIGFGISSNLKYKLHVQGSNAASIAGFGSYNSDGAILYIYTSNNTSSNFELGIDINNNFIIRDNINGDLNGIKYNSDILKVDNIITSNITIISELGHVFNASNFINYNNLENKPFYFDNDLSINIVKSSNSVKIKSLNNSALDVCGITKLYNENNIFPVQVQCDLNSVSFLTNNGIPYKYTNTNIINPLSLFTSGIDFLNNNTINKIVYSGSNHLYLSTNNTAYIDYNGIYFSNIIFNNPLSNILDIAIDDNTIYYINNNDFKIYYSGNSINVNTNTPSYNIDYSLLINDNIKYKKIKVGNNFGVILDEANNLYSFGLNSLYQLGRIISLPFEYNLHGIITGLPNLLIKDFSCGYSHTAVLFDDGSVWTFGDNTAYKRGYIGDPFNNSSFILPNKITSVYDKIIKVECSYNNTVLLSDNGNVYIAGDITNKLNISTTVPLLLTNIPKIIDISCSKNNVALLSYYNEIFTFNNLNTVGDYTGTGRDLSSGSQYIPNLLNLPYNFYNTSLYSHGSVVIGNSYFNKLASQSHNIPKNSLIIEGKVGIGTVPLLSYSSNDFSMTIVGDMNIINGNIYQNGSLIQGTGQLIQGSIQGWELTETSIYYKGLSTTNVGIGTTNPSRTLTVNGDIGLTGDIYVNDKLLINDFVLWSADKNNASIYYQTVGGKVGINTDVPLNSLDIFDTATSIRNVVNISNLTDIDNNLILSLDPLSTTNDFGNNISISGNGNTIATSIFKTYNENFNSNSVFIYNKTTNNTWNKSEILSSIKQNITFGNSLAVSYDGSIVVIGTYNDYTMNGMTKVYKGSIYICNTNNFTSNIINSDDDVNILKIYGPNNRYIGLDIAISSNVNTIVSTAFADNTVLYVYEKNGLNYINNNIDYTNVSYHISFGNSIDISNDGKIIVATFVLNQMVPFLYNNIYIIKKSNSIWSSPKFLTKNINNNNYIINNVSLSGDGNILVLGITDNTNLINKDVIYIYRLNNDLIFNNYYNIPTPHYILKLPSNNVFNAKISKDGFSILLTPTTILTPSDVLCYQYRYDRVLDNWILTKIETINQDIYTIKGDIVDNGYNVALAYGNTVLINDRATTPLNSIIKLVDIYQDKYTFYSDKTGNISIGSNNTVKGYDLFVNGSIGANNIVSCSANISNLTANNLAGDGEFIKNVNIININGNGSNINDGQLFIGNCNLIKQTSNLYWDFNSNSLFIDGILNSKIIYSDDGFNIKNINLNYIGSNTILSITSGGTGTSNYLVDHLLFGNNDKLNQSSNLLFRDDTLYVNGNTISKFIGDGYNISNLNILNLNNGLIDVLYGGTGVSNLHYNQLIIGNLSNIYQTSNLYWDIINNRLGINNENPIVDLDVKGVISASNYIGSGDRIYNIVASNIIGEVSVINGGTGCNLIPYGNLLIGNETSLITTPNLVWSNVNNELIINGTIIANTIVANIYGDAFNLSNINASNIVGKISTENGGIGDLNIIRGNILFGGYSNDISTSSNLFWNNSNNRFGINNNNPRSELDVIGKITASYYLGNGAGLSNLVASNVIGEIAVINGGTGCNNIPYGSIVVGNDNLGIITSRNLLWSNLENKLTVIGDIYGNTIQGRYIGNGNGLSNLVASNIIGEVSVINGGTGCNCIPYGNVIIGNDCSAVITSSNFIWSNVDNQLLINGSIYANKLQGYYVGDGSGLSNILFNSINGSLDVINGGTGCNLIPYGNVIVGNDTSAVITSSNFVWSNVDNQLLINGSIYANSIQGSFVGDGRGLSNLEYNDIVGEIQVINGGTGCNTIPYGSIVVGNDNLGIIITPNLLWSNQENKLIVKGDIYGDILQGRYIGNGNGLSNLIASNIIGEVSVINGGTGCNTIPYGSVVVGNDNLGIIITPNLLWSNLENKLTVIGDIYGNTIQGRYIGNGNGLSNLVASNIIGALSVINGGTGCNTIPYGSVLVGNDNLGIITSQNLSWSNLENKLTVIGDIYGNTIQGRYIGNGNGLSNLVASNIIGALSVINGGTGCNLLQDGQLLVGNTLNIYQTSNLYWNSIDNRLGINTSKPNYNLDINGDINFNGNLLRNGYLYITPSGFSNLSTANTIYTLSNLLLGYTEPDNNYRLKVNGKIYSSDDITAFSDKKYKTNIITIDNALEKVNNLRGVYFNRTDIQDSKRHVGVIAQEINEILPEVVSASDTAGLSVAYGNITALLIEAIKDMSKKIEFLESKLYKNE